jgi:ABC-2 type transport system ATP-binding protein
MTTSTVRQDGDNAVAVQAVGKRYGENWALVDCSFDLPRGCVAALVGPNGAGKSTLLRTLAGELRPSTGAVSWPDEDGASRPREHQPRVRLVPQAKVLYPTFTAADMLDLGRRFNRVWDSALAADWLRSFDVPLDRQCRKLSGGQRTHVTLAFNLATRPDVLLLDEPLGDLDPLARDDVVGRVLAHVAEYRTTVLLSTHIVAELPGVADHLLLLSHGRLLLSGDVDRLTRQHVWITGPRSDVPPGEGTVIHAAHDERRSRFLVRMPATHECVLHPNWQAATVRLDEMVLHYLRGESERDSQAGVRNVG